MLHRQVATLASYDLEPIFALGPNDQILQDPISLDALGESRDQRFVEHAPRVLFRSK